MSPIPKNAKCVYDGIRFSIYQWEQKQFDGTYKTFEVAKRRETIQTFIVTNDKKIVLSKEEQPYVGKYVNLPGGYIENGDDGVGTVKKELLEEFGIKYEKISLWKEVCFGSIVVMKKYYYIAKGCKVVQEPDLESGERIEALKVDFDEFLEMTQKDNFRDKYLQGMICDMMKNKGEIEKLREELFG